MNAPQRRNLPTRIARRAGQWALGTPTVLFFIMMLALLPFAAAAMLSNWLTVSDNPASDTTAQIIALLMPLLLWFSAAFVAWLVARWILIEPLTALRREVANYAPGKILHILALPKAASREVRELSEAFHALSATVAQHDSEMLGALSRQKQLTREIHHRVKNNLQVVSSLISLHWRAAKNSEAAAAYLAIQRRVDALSVVQRNYYAELEEQTGVRARAILSEIATGLKTSAKIQSNQSLDVEVHCDDLCLSLDVAAPLAFMTVELADLVIAQREHATLILSLSLLPDAPLQARYTLESSIFQAAPNRAIQDTDLCERVLSGLARQLRTPLDHDSSAGRYSIVVPVV